MKAQLEKSDSGIVLISECPEDEAMLKKLWIRCKVIETRGVSHAGKSYIELLISPE
jgi:hypothetical protein